MLNSDCKINFNNQVNEGNPIYYWADIEKLDKIGSFNSVLFNKGLEKYIEWVNEIS